MKSKFFNLAIFVGFLVLVSCSFRPLKLVPIKIVFPESGKARALGGAWEVDCYFVDVNALDLPSFVSRSSYLSPLSLGLTSDLVSSDSNFLTAQIPIGYARTIRILGIRFNHYADASPVVVDCNRLNLKQALAMRPSPTLIEVGQITRSISQTDREISDLEKGNVNFDLMSRLTPISLLPVNTPMAGYITADNGIISTLTTLESYPPNYLSGTVFDSPSSSNNSLYSFRLRANASGARYPVLQVSFDFSSFDRQQFSRVRVCTLNEADCENTGYLPSVSGFRIFVQRSGIWEFLNYEKGHTDYPLDDFSFNGQFLIVIQGRGSTESTLPADFILRKDDLRVQLLR